MPEYVVLEGEGALWEREPTVDMVAREEEELKIRRPA
jgi:hypothetical protein